MVIALQAGAEVLVQPTAAVAREVFWELADSLLAPCSLFDAADTLLLHRSMMELASSNTEQAAAMQGAFFGSSKVGLRHSTLGGAVVDAQLACVVVAASALCE